MLVHKPKHRCTYATVLAMASPFQFTPKEITDQGRVPLECFDHIKKWCLAENLPTLHDQQLILFLLSCENNLELTKHTIHAYFLCKNEAPDIFDNRNMDAEDVQKAIKVCDFSLLPVRNPWNEAVVTWRLKDTCYYKLHLEGVMKTLLMVGELIFHQDPPTGLVVVLDLTGVGLLHLTRLRIGALKKFFHYIQEGIPIKLRHIHVLNTVYFIDKIMKIFRPLMKEELYNMIKFHPTNMDMNEFFDKHLPMDCMPADYGGSLACIDVLSVESYRAVRNYHEYMKEEQETAKKYKRPPRRSLTSLFF